MTATASKSPELYAFAFTDIEGSSLLWLNHRATMQEALSAHDKILRETISRHGGKVFKTAGDAFFAVFRRPSDAVQAVSAAQIALAGRSWPGIGPLKARMAIHFGTAEKRGGDYFGPALNRCARLLSLAHGGQILVTSAVAELLSSEREAACSVRLLGSHPLDDPLQRVGVHQVLVEGLPQDFPPLRIAQVHPNNLPRPQGTLFGRDAELMQIAGLLATTDLVTVTGTGGVGKTRLAIEVGLSKVADHEDGVWLVELAAVTDPAMVPRAVARAMHIDIQADEDPLACLVDRLLPRHCLIVLDNCEHVIDAAAALVKAVLERAPDVKLLVSSQEMLGIPGEQVFRLRSLGEPDAAALFTERARAADAGFVVGQGSDIVAAICQRLDGIPLAIEMAAARAPSIGCDGLLRHLDDRFRVLTGGSRTALPRQRTLLATLEWSHGLLSARNAAVYRRLGVFLGGFTLDAASAVAADEQIDAFEVIDALSNLVAKSLITAETEDNRTRYRLLETGRAYALEKLAASGETLATQRRHAQVMLNFVAPVRADYYGAIGEEAFAMRYFPEGDNIDRALDWAFGPDGDPQLGIAIAAAAGFIFMARYRYREYIDRLKTAEAHMTDATPETVRCTFLLARATVYMVNNQGVPGGVIESAIEAARASGDPVALSEALNAAGYTALFTGRRAEARTLSHESLAIVDGLALSKLTAQAHHVAAYITLVESGDAAARPLFDQVVTELRAIGEEGLATWFLLTGTTSLIPQDNINVAIAELRSTLARIRPWHMYAGNSTGLAASHLAYCLATRAKPADIEEARAVARTFRKVASRGAGGGTVYMYYIAIALIAAASGRPQSAARLGGFVEALRATQGNVLARGQQQIERLRRTLEGHLSGPELAALWAEGARLNQDVADRLAVDES